MKIDSLQLTTFVLAAVTLAAPAAHAQATKAQTTHTQTTTRRRTTTAAHKPAAAPCPPAQPAPAVPANLPPAPGQVESAFALRYVDIKVGDGPESQPGQFYTVHYTGWLASDGTKFDSSLDRNEPFTFPQGMHRVIPGWDYGLTGMHAGGKRRLFIPYQLAYGERGRPPVIPPKSDLIFDIEMISASDTPPSEALPPPPPPPPPSTPPPAGTPPTSATPPSGSTPQ